MHSDFDIRGASKENPSFIASQWRLFCLSKALCISIATCVTKSTGREHPLIDVSFPTKSTRPLRPLLAIYDRMMMPYANANASFFWPSGLVSDYTVRSFGHSLPSPPTSN